MLCDTRNNWFQNLVEAIWGEQKVRQLAEKAKENFLTFNTGRFVIVRMRENVGVFRLKPEVEGVHYDQVYMLDMTGPGSWMIDNPDPLALSHVEGWSIYTAYRWGNSRGQEWTHQDTRRNGAHFEELRVQEWSEAKDDAMDQSIRPFRLPEHRSAPHDCARSAFANLIP